LISIPISAPRLLFSRPKHIAANEAVEKPFLQKNTLIFTAPISLHHTAII
jgi:hypothetical protein